ncbi:NTP/NDP exchange transporter [Roseimaritima sediminicola]|uniref:NTP/NDP exchange transporter n=1 Tax=Roseimaritima sediminicola TaxID=2662066 RepID=UPI00129833AE|nr:MFS transporter [Roseimaritima sediminicola]
MRNSLPTATPAERRCVAWAFAWFFCILAAYFVLRPVRETFAVARGTGELPGLFAATLLAVVIASPLFAALAARLSRRRLVKTVYRFFAVNIALFWAAAQLDAPRLEPWLARGFFVWISLFALFNTSVFWSVMADLFSNAQAKRLFGWVAAGGTCGALAGSLLTATLASQLGPNWLLLLPIVFLELGVQFASQLQRHAETLPEQTPSTRLARPTGGSVWAGLARVVRSPYLLTICGFLLLGQFAATHLYLTQIEIVERFVSTTERTSLFAMLNLATQLLTLALQTFVFAAIARRKGVAPVLVTVPLIYAGCFLALNLAPRLETLVVVVVLCSGLTYGMIVPSREVLFTVVSREDKYKSKNFIDTAIMRGGDTTSATILGWLQPALLSTAFVIAVMGPLALLWGAVGWWLGRRQQRLAAWTRASSVAPAATRSVD